ncbi:hypothetical protein [Serratia fonticola]|uniref:hypothetical protein n=1 Tax=Serratia fonticola TaxID=47917 RepID=UPI00093F0D35|nr:hypothetical protein [Serratia fonticola]OKP21811.1 hypothetical protein BSQ40_25645 [Serratia fonticola]
MLCEKNILGPIDYFNMALDVENKNKSTFTISLNEIFKLCNEIGVSRLIKKEEDYKFVSIVICGVGKIRKNKRKGNLSFWRYNLTSLKGGVWMRVSTPPTNCPIFFSNNNIYSFKDSLVNAVSWVLESLLKLGFSVIDRANIIHELYYERYELSFYDAEGADENVGSCEFSLSATSFNAKHASISRLSQCWNVKEAKKKAIEKLMTRFSAFIREADFVNAAKSFNLNVRSILDKDTFSTCIRVFANSILYESVMTINLAHYVTFSRELTVEGELDSLFPFLRLYKRSIGNVVISGKTKQLYQALKLNEFLTYNDLKYLRASKATFSAFIANVINDGNDPLNVNVPLVVKVLRHPLSKKYPVKVLLWVVKEIKTSMYGVFDDEKHTASKDKLYRVIDRWLDYHQTLFNNIGFKQQEQRWRTEVNHLEHVIYWLVQTDANINKNQNWPSFQRLATKWIAEYRIDSCEGEHIKPEWEGVAVDWSQSLKGSAKVSEITCLVDLENEGNVMQHCVVTYHGFCAYGSYRVFSLNMNNERATLGLSRMPNKAVFQHDQIRGLSNDAVSNDMVKLGRKVLSIVNQVIKE